MVNRLEVSLSGRKYGLTGVYRGILVEGFVREDTDFSGILEPTKIISNSDGTLYRVTNERYLVELSRLKKLRPEVKRLDNSYIPIYLALVGMQSRFFPKNGERFSADIKLEELITALHLSQADLTPSSLADNVSAYLNRLVEDYMTVVRKLREPVRV